MTEPTSPHHQSIPRTSDEWISLSRLLLAGILWIPALLRKPRLVAAGIMLSALTDMADGFVARIRGTRSGYARQLDTIADSAIMLSSIGWLALTRPGALAPLRRTIATILLIATGLLAVQWHRYRVFGALHLDSARAAAVLGHLYVLQVLWRNTASKALLRLTQCFAAGAIAESAWVILFSHDPGNRSPRPLLRALIRRGVP